MGSSPVTVASTSENYRVWVHSGTRTWNDKNIQSGFLIIIISSIVIIISVIHFSFFHFIFYYYHYRYFICLRVWRECVPRFFFFVLFFHLILQTTFVISVTCIFIIIFHIIIVIIIFILFLSALFVTMGEFNEWVRAARCSLTHWLFWVNPSLLLFSMCVIVLYLCKLLLCGHRGGVDGLFYFYQMI